MKISPRRIATSGAAANVAATIQSGHPFFCFDGKPAADHSPKLTPLYEVMSGVSACHEHQKTDPKREPGRGGRAVPAKLYLCFALVSLAL